MSVFREDRVRQQSGTAAPVSKLSTLIRVAILAVLLFAIYQVIAGSGEPEDLSPRLVEGTEVDRLELPDSMSAATIAKIDGEHFLAVVTKFGADRLEPATLHLVHIGANEDMELVASIESPVPVESPPSGIAVVGGFAYVPVAGTGREDPQLWIGNLHDPRSPETEELVDVDMPLRSLSTLEERFLVASGFDTDFHLYDLSAPTEPDLHAEFTISISVAPDIQVDGNTLFIDHMAGIVIVDLSNPREPSEVSRIDHPDWRIPGVPPTGVALLTPEERFDYQIPEGNFLGMSVSDDLLAIAASDLGLLFFDVADIANPRPKGDVSAEGRVPEVEVSGGLVSMIEAVPGDDGRFRYTVQVFEDDSPDTLRRIAEFDAPHRFLHPITVEGDLYILANTTVIKLLH